MPYFPNSMVMNQGGSNLYFGSYRELMVFSIPSNKLAKEDTSVPGVVLGVSPDGATVVINDQLRKVFYLYNFTSGTSTSFGGVGTAAAFTPDSNTLYIAGPTTLYIHSNFTGWSSYDISGNESGASACMASNNLNSVYAPPGFPNPPYNPFCGPDAAITVPGVGAFISGSQTIAHGFCPDTTVPANPVYYPLAASVGASTAHVAASNDGQAHPCSQSLHILRHWSDGSNRSLPGKHRSVDSVDYPYAEGSSGECSQHQPGHIRSQFGFGLRHLQQRDRSIGRCAALLPDPDQHARYNPLGWRGFGANCRSLLLRTTASSLWAHPGTICCISST